GVVVSDREGSRRGREPARLPPPAWRRPGAPREKPGPSPPRAPGSPRPRAQHGPEDQDADAGGDPHPIADNEAKDDQHQKRRDGRRRAGVVIVMTVIHGALDLRSYVRVSPVSQLMRNSPRKPLRTATCSHDPTRTHPCRPEANSSPQGQPPSDTSGRQ